MSSLRISETNYETKLTVQHLNAAVVSKTDQLVDDIASISIENLGALFRLAARDANELRGLFGLLAENHRKAFLGKAKEIKSIQGGWGSTLSHLANVGGSVMSGFGESHEKLKAAGAGVSATSSFISTQQSAKSTYEDAMKTAVSQSMGKAYEDVSRAQSQADECMRTLDAFKQTIQAAKGAMMR